MYVKATNGIVDTYPYNVGQLRRDNPKTSFPKRISDDMLDDWAVYPVEYKPQPDYDDRAQRLEQNAQPTLENGKWVIGWSVSVLAPEEVTQRAEQQANDMRTKRDRMIADTDWMALSDNTMSAGWATYRQALRDITGHANFPYLTEADWPVKPE
jgi:hypothetical protein